MVMCLLVIGLFRTLFSHVRDGGVTVRLESDYPFKNSARYTVDADRAFTFLIRLPSFAENLTVNGESHAGGTYRTEIRPGHTEITVAFETVPALIKRPNGLFALRAGSLLFSVPIGYEKQAREYTKRGVARKAPYCDYSLIPQTDWNYAFAAEGFAVSRQEISAFPFSQEQPPVTVRARLRKIDWGMKFPYRTVCRRTPRSTAPLSAEEDVLLIPYGCARLRMTEMPLLK